MTLKEKARDMRNAINDMELALMGAPELIDLPERWGEPRFMDHIYTTINIKASQVYRIGDALSELTRIINSPEYYLS